MLHCDTCTAFRLHVLYEPGVCMHHLWYVGTYCLSYITCNIILVLILSGSRLLLVFSLVCCPRYHVFEIGEPFLTYQINVTVQQYDTMVRVDTDEVRELWHTIGYATVGPERPGDNTANRQTGETSTPKVSVWWECLSVDTPSTPS